MKYAVSNWIYGEEPLHITAARLAKLGYDGVELTGEPSRYSVRETARLLADHGLEVSSVCGIYTKERDLTNPEPRAHQAAVDYVKSCIEFAHKLRARTLILVPTPVGKTNPSINVSEDWKRSVESVRQAAEFACQAGVVIAVEPINRYETYLVNNCEQALRYADEVGSPCVKVMLDTFHMNIEERDLAEAVRKAGKRLVHVHVADSNRQSTGRGHTDFQGLVRSLDGIGYSGYLVMEPLPPVADVYSAASVLVPEATIEGYARECIDYLKLLEGGLRGL
ncbi:MAG: sugar phosphate isomerase/epimerase family protein [Bacillota bacterium]|nr:sugar phosphate isomerase/epimerase family protein [Bacillota bacterium]